MIEEVTSEQAEATPGPLLKAAREQAGLTTQQVAQRLNLRHSVVLGMETDSYEPGMSFTYIRGYLRNYARLVGLNEQKLNQRIEALRQEDPSPQMQSFSGKTHRQRTDNRWKVVSWFIAAAIVGLVVWWWLATKDVRQFLPETESTSTNVVEQQPASVVQSTPQTSLPSPAASEPAVSLPEVADKTEVETASAVNDTTIGNEVDRESDSVSEQANSDEAVDVNVTSTSNEPVVMNTLTVRLSADCWMLVEDVNGQVILEGLKPKGYDKTLTGTAPFSLRIGAPEAVSLRFDGEAVDLSAYRPGRVARLTLPM